MPKNKFFFFENRWLCLCQNTLSATPPFTQTLLPPLDDAIHPIIRAHIDTHTHTCCHILAPSSVVSFLPFISTHCTRVFSCFYGSFKFTLYTLFEISICRCRLFNSSIGRHAVLICACVCVCMYVRMCARVKEFVRCFSMLLQILSIRRVRKYIVAIANHTILYYKI